MKTFKIMFLWALLLQNATGYIVIDNSLPQNIFSLWADPFISSKIKIAKFQYNWIIYLINTYWVTIMSKMLCESLWDRNTEDLGIKNF